MSVSTHIFVEWDNENRFSVEQRNKIVSASFRLLKDSKLIGKKVKAKYQGKVYDAIIHDCGDKTEMDQALKAKVGKKKKGNNNVEDEVEEIEEILNESDPIENEEIDYKALYEEEKKKTEKYKKKSKERKEEVDDLSAKCGQLEKETAPELKKLAPGVYIMKWQWEKAGGFKTSSKFVKNLMRAMFADDEIIGKSLKGGKSPIPGTPQKESIDPARREAIMNQALKRFAPSNDVNIRNGVLATVTSAMTAYIREVTEAANGVAATRREKAKRRRLEMNQNLQQAEDSE